MFGQVLLIDSHLAHQVRHLSGLIDQCQRVPPNSTLAPARGAANLNCRNRCNAEVQTDEISGSG